MLLHIRGPQKAYDSVPREALWIILQKLGVPERIINLIHSLHQGMSAKIRIDGLLSEQIDVNNGLRQGCCLSSVLFNLFSCAVLERWKQKLNGVDGFGVPSINMIRSSTKDIPRMQTNFYYVNVCLQMMGLYWNGNGVIC